MKKLKKLGWHFLSPFALSTLPLVISSAPSDGDSAQDENIPKAPSQISTYDWDIEYVTLPQRYVKFTQFSDDIKAQIDTYLNTKRMQMYKKVLSDDFERDFIDTDYNALFEYFKEKAQEYDLSFNTYWENSQKPEFKMWIIDTVEKIVASMLNKEEQDETLNDSELYENVLAKVMSLYSSGDFLTTYKEYIDTIFKYLSYISKGLDSKTISLDMDPTYERAILIEIPLSFQEIGNIENMVSQTKKSYQKLIDKIKPKLTEFEVFQDANVTEKDNWARNQLTNDNKFALFQDLTELEYYGMKNAALNYNSDSKKLDFKINSAQIQLVEEETVDKDFYNKNKFEKLENNRKETTLKYLTFLKASFDKKELSKVEGYKTDFELQTFFKIFLLAETVNEQNVYLSKRKNTIWNNLYNYSIDATFFNDKLSNTFDNLIYQDERVHNIFTDIFNILINFTNNNIENLDSEFLIKTFLYDFKSVLKYAFSSQSIFYKSNDNHYDKTEESLYNTIIKSFETVINFYKREIVDEGLENENTVSGLLKNLKEISQNIGLENKLEINSLTKTGKELNLDNKSNNYYLYKSWKEKLDEFLEKDNVKLRFKNNLINDNIDYLTISVKPGDFFTSTTSYNTSDLSKLSTFTHIDKFKEKLSTKQYTSLLHFLKTDVLSKYNNVDAPYNFDNLPENEKQLYNENSLAQDDMFYTITEKINNALINRIENITDEESYNKYISFIKAARRMYHNNELSKKYVQFIINIRERLSYENLSEELNTLLANKLAEELAKVEIKDEDVSLDEYYETLITKYEQIKKDLRNLNDNIPRFTSAINKAKEVKNSDVYTQSEENKRNIFDSFLNIYENWITDDKLNVYMSNDQLISQINSIDSIIKLLGSDSDIETTDKTYLNKLKTFISDNLTNLQKLLNNIDIPESNDNWDFDNITLVKTSLSDEITIIKESLDNASYDKLIELLPKLLEKENQKQLLEKKLELHKLINDNFHNLSETKKEKLKQVLVANNPDLDLIRILLETEESAKDEKITKLEQEIRQMHDLLEISMNKIDDLTATITEKDNQLLSKDATINEKDIAISEKEAKITELEASLNEKLEKITKLQKEIARKDTQYQNDKKQSTFLTNKYSNLFWLFLIITIILSMINAVLIYLVIKLRKNRK